MIAGLFFGGGILVGLSFCFCLGFLVVGLGSFWLFWFGIVLLLLVGCFFVVGWLFVLVFFLSKPPVKIPACLE